MTSPERLSAEALATYAAWTRDAKATGLIAEINQYGPSYLEIGMLAREVQASRRLAPLHAAAVALADLEMRYTFHDGQPVSESEWMAGRDAYRAARRALEPQPMQHNDNLRIVREEAEVAVEGDSSQFQHWLILRPGDKVSVIRASAQPDREDEHGVIDVTALIDAGFTQPQREALVEFVCAALRERQP